MRIITLKVGYGANCYIVSDDKTSNSVVIDPGAQGKRISIILDENRLILKAVFLTHGHFDHISGLKELLECREECPKIWISSTETEISAFPYRPDCLEGITLNNWNDEENLSVDTMTFKVLCTPGHSPGSVCVMTEDILFTGDILFRNSIGRTDFIGSDKYAMENSLRRITSLKGDFRILPGHESETTLSKERRFNPYLKALIKKISW